jgi:hypothetical protein
LKTTSVSQLIKNTGTADFLNGAIKELIFFAINNDESMQSGGGSHWSLLAFSLNENTFL